MSATAMTAEVINGYKIIKPFTTVGAGTASWTFAEKNREIFFLKRFNSPKYMPSCMVLCDQYENRKRKLYQKIRELDNGNLVVIEEFFHFDTFYYIATKRVPEASITAEQAYMLPTETLLIIMRTLAHCMMQLEKGGIVHADLKPSNVMLKPTVGNFYSLKLIDFDSSFFVSDPPNEEGLEGDIAYLSPEVLMALCGENVELTSKLDVFALGIMFHQFLSGEFPGYDRSEYESVCEAVANNAKITLSSSIPELYRPLILQMLKKNPEERPTFRAVFTILSESEKRNSISTTRLAAEPRLKVNKPEKPWLKMAGDL